MIRFNSMVMGMLESGVWDRDVLDGGWEAGKGKEGDELWDMRVDVVSGGGVAEGNLGSIYQAGHTLKYYL